MILRIIAVVPALLNIGVFWYNRNRSSQDLKNIFITFQLVLAVVAFFTGGFWSALGKLLFVLLVKILSAGFIKGCWVISCVLDVFTILRVMGG